MTHAHEVSVRSALGALLSIACLVYSPGAMFAQNTAVGDIICRCPGLAKNLGSAPNCEVACFGSSNSTEDDGDNSRSTYDHEAERRAREAAAANRQRQQDELDRIERERVAAKQREKEEQQAKFIRERNAVVLKGSSGISTPQLKGLSGAFNHGLKGSGTEAGAQLKTVERHSREAQDEASRGKDTARETARRGFDISGDASGNLVYPDKNKYRQLPSSALERHIPPEARENPEVQKMLAWYRSLDAQKAETTQKIATIKEQQKQGTGDASVLSAQLGTLTDQDRRIEKDKTTATKGVKAEVKRLGFEWIERPEPTTTEAKSK